MRAPDFDAIFRHLEVVLIEARASEFQMLVYLLKMAVLETHKLLEQHSFAKAVRR